MSAQSVTISDTTTGATIYYTTDGATPTTNSAIYSTPINISSTQTVNAIAVAVGYINSTVATATYTINIPQAATPTFSPAGGTFTSSQSVTISDATTGATIYYTTDGSTPTTSSAQYNGAISVSSTETIEAIASASGYVNSNAATATYTIDAPTALPVGTSPSGNITSLPLSVLALSSATTEADRRALVGMAANSSSGTATATFTYNNANRLASVTGVPLAASFTYDWSGQRFNKANPGSAPILYSYMQGGTLITENDNGAVTDYIYADGRPIAVLQPGATTAANQINYVHADRLGTPQVVTSSSGSAVWSTTYQPFGTTGVVNAAINQTLRFPGQNFDAETGFNYNRNRDYIPNVGRYLESDPIGLAGGVNTYQYGDASPLRWTDASGLDAIYFGITIGGQAGWQLNPSLSSGLSDFYGLGISYSYQGYIPVPNDIGFITSHSSVDRYNGIGYGIAASSTANFCAKTLVDLETKPGDQPSKSLDVDFGAIGPIGGFSYSPGDGSVALNIGSGGRSIRGFGISSNTTNVYSFTRWLGNTTTEGVLP